MAYVIVKSNGTTLTTIADGTINISSTSVALPGKNYAGYGQYLDTNFVHMIENFADGTPPSNPLRGQLWYNTNNSTMYICPTDGDVNPSNWFAITTTSSGGNSTIGNVTVTGNINANNVTATNNMDANSISVDYLTVNVSSVMSNANVTATANINTLRTTAITTGAQSTNGTLTGVWLANGAGVANGVSGTAFYVTGGNLVIANTSGRGLVTDNIYFSNGSPWTSGSGNASGNYSNANVANYLPVYSGNILTNVTTALTLTTGAAGTAGNIVGNWTVGAGSTLRANTVTTNAQPNITSVGSLTSLTVVGNVTANNGTFSNRVVANLFQGDGGLLTNISVSAGTSLVHGTSNVLVANNGNVTFGVAGVANALQVVSTGIIVNTVANILGNAQVGGNISVVGNVTATNFFGRLANGLSNVEIPTAGGNVNITSGATLQLVTTSTGVNVAGTLNVVGNANLGNLGTAGAISATGAITGGTLVGPLTAGTSNISIATNGNITVTRSGTTRLTVTNTGITVNGPAVVGAVTYTNTDGSVGQVLTTYGNGITYWSTAGGGGGGGSSISNGTSSVSIPGANGNVFTNVGGVANVMIATTTGVNVTGYCNITGAVTASSFAGNGSGLTGITVQSISNGLSNVSIPAAGGNISCFVGTAEVFRLASTTARVTAGNLVVVGNSSVIPSLIINNDGVANSNRAAIQFMKNSTLRWEIVQDAEGNATVANSFAIYCSATSAANAAFYVRGNGTAAPMIGIANTTPTTAYRLSVNGPTYIAGNLDVVGNITATQNIIAYTASDSRLKDNINTIENALDKIKKISGVMFDWKDGYELDRKHDTGLIAQEVEEVLPEVVITRQDGYKAVRYEKVIGLVVQAIKELADQVEELKKR